MRLRLLAVLIGTLLLAPAASAWTAGVESVIDGDLSARTSLLLAGHLTATAEGTRFGAPLVHRADFGDALVVCVRSDYPDAATLPSPPRDAAADPANCTDGERHRAARVRVLSGGLLVTPTASDTVTFEVPAGVGALGGGNLSLDGVPIGPGLFAGGASTLIAGGSTFALRPIGEDPSVEVRGMDGFETYNGTEYTFTLSNADGAFLESPGGFLQLGIHDTVRLTRAPMRTAEDRLDVDALHILVRELVPPDRADRRADLVNAFGPFQVVPALLNGAVSQAHNLTLGPRFHESQLVFQVENATLVRANNTWSGHANGTSTVQAGRVSADTSSGHSTPVLIPALLGIAAIAGRVATHRGVPRRRGRLVGRIAWTLSALMVTLWAANATAALLGANPIIDWGALSDRSRVQLLLLVTGTAATAGVLVSVSVASLVRSLLSWRGRASAVVIPPAAGAVAALLLIWLAAAPLVSLVARFVRL